jgi:hypothetical protein
MKKTKGAFIFLFLAVIILAVGQPALASRNSATTAGDPVLDIDKSAGGTSLYGTITIDYKDGLGSGDMDIFLRITKGNKLYGFSATKPYTDYYGDISQQQDAVEGFIEETVIPYIYCCGGDAQVGCDSCPVICDCNPSEGIGCFDTCPSFSGNTLALKSFDNCVENEEDTGPLVFTIMDIVIKVVD